MQFCITVRQRVNLTLVDQHQILDTVDEVEFVLEQCIEESDDFLELDRRLISLRLCYIQVTHLINTGVLISNLIDPNLSELQHCLSQLCVEYETKMLTKSMGRPRKIINFALVS